RHFNQVHAVTQRAIGTLEDTDLDFRPRPEARSTRELVHHMYAAERTLAVAARDGGFNADLHAPHADQGKRMTSLESLLGHARECQESANLALAALTDEALSRVIVLPPAFGVSSAPAWQCFTFSYQEHWHHRGELWMHITLLGKAYQDIYDYEGAVQG